MDSRGNTQSGYDRNGVKATYKASAKAGTVKYKTTANLNCRSGPGTSYKRLGTLKKGTVISADASYAKKVNGTYWYRFKKDGKWCYVSGKYLKRT